MERIDKKNLRVIMREKRKALSSNKVELASEFVCQELAKLPEVLNAKNIMIYMPLANEIRLYKFMDFLFEKGIGICVPHCIDYDNNIMEAVKVNADTKFYKNILGSIEPENGEPIDKKDIDVVVVPALAFNDEMYRLGYGAGYYDRFLENVNIYKVGVGYKFQKISLNFQDPFDVPMEKVILSDVE